MIGIVSVILEVVVASTGGSFYLALIGVVLAGAGACFTYITLKTHSRDMPPAVRDEAELGLGMDIAAVGAALAKLFTQG